MPRINSRATPKAALALALAFAATMLPAAGQSTFTWTNPAGGSWGDDTNWTPSPSFVSGVVLDFSTLDLSTALTTTLDGSRTAGTLRFGDTSPSHHWTVNPGSGGTLTLSATGTPGIEVVAQDAIISAVVVGNQGFEKTGDGTLIFTATNTYTGTTTITGGTLQLGNGGATGSIPGAVNIGAAGTLRQFFDTNPTTLSNTVSGSGTWHFEGTGLSQQSDYNVTGNASSFSGAAIVDKARVRVDHVNDLGSATVVKVQPGGQLYLRNGIDFDRDVEIAGDGWSGNAGYLGVIRIQQSSVASGTITLTDDARIAAYGATGSLTGTLAESGGAHTLDLRNRKSGTPDAVLTLANSSTRTGPTTVAGLRALVTESGAFGSGTVSVEDNGSAARLTRLDLDGVTLANDIVLNSAATTGAAGALFATGGGTTALSGSVTVTATVSTGGHLAADTGATLRLDGPLDAAPGIVARIGPGTVELGGGGNAAEILHREGTLRLSADNGLPTDAYLQAATAGDSIIDLNGHDQTLEGIGSGTRISTITNGGSADATLTLGAATNRSYNGTIADGPTHRTSLVKTGASTLSFTEVQSYTGLTDVQEGVVEFLPGLPDSTLPADLKIMPIGDSITNGSSGSHAGYRGYLHDLLDPVAPSFQFVGPTVNNPDDLPTSPIDQTHHCGFPSYPTVYLMRNLDGFDDTSYQIIGGDSRDPLGGYWLTGGHDTGRAPIEPDFALLMVGANDITWGEKTPPWGEGVSLAQYPENLTNLLNAFLTIRPGTHIIVARPTPGDKHGAKIDVLTAAVDTVVATLQAEGKPVSKVDLNTGFPLPEGISNDNIHPTNIGYEWMAQRWFEGIVAAAATSGTGGPPASLPDHAGIQVAAGATVRFSGQDQILDELTGAGELQTGGSVLTLGGDGSTFTFDGIISGAGSLRKQGGGHATLTGANSWTDATEITAGTLELSQATLADASTIAIAAGATLLLAHAEVDEVGALVLDDTPQAAGVYGSPESDAPNRVAVIAGPGTLRVGPPGYESWAASYVDGQSPELDFDHDGTPNGIEYFMGTTTPGFTPIPPIIDRSISWPRDPSATVSVLRVEISQDLVDWTRVDPDDPALNVTDTSVVYQLAAGRSFCFCRLVVSP